MVGASLNGFLLSFLPENLPPNHIIHSWSSRKGDMFSAPLSTQLRGHSIPEPPPRSCEQCLASHFLASVQVTLFPGWRPVCWPPGPGSAWAWGKGVPGKMSLSSDQATGGHTVDCSACRGPCCQPLPLLTTASQPPVPASSDPQPCWPLLSSSHGRTPPAVGGVTRHHWGGHVGSGRPEAPHQPSSIPAKDCLPPMTAQYGPFKLP